MRKLWRLAAAVLCGVWILLAAGCGGGGGGGAAAPGASAGAPDAEAAPGVPATAQKWQLFVADGAHIALFADAQLAPNTTVRPDATLRVAGLERLAYDASRDLLYASTHDPDGASTIVVFTDASGLAEGSAPARRILLNPAFIAPSAIHIDSVRDELYVAVNRVDPGGGKAIDGQVQVFARASEAGGAVAPSRVLQMDHNVDFTLIDAARSTMYAGDTFSLVTYKGIDTANPQRGDTIARGSSSSFGYVLDTSHDRLYAIKNASVVVFDHASTAATLTRTIAIPTRLGLGLAGPGAYDPRRDRLYLSGLAQVFVIDGVSQLLPGSTATALAVDLPIGSDVKAFVFP